ncbi:MAG: histidine kinase [Planctomycetota bacterium]|nr:histidine kinase [Planctomycetota bacterium]
MTTSLKASDRLSWELATESIVVRIRWFGIAMGYVLALTRTGLHNASAVCAFLALGAGYAALDTAFHRMGEVFLIRWPLFVSSMESIFIALLCYHDTGMDSPFRWYYLLSLICCAIRSRPAVAWTTFGLHCLSLVALAWALGQGRSAWSALPLTVALLAWVTWASSALASLLKATGASLEQANSELELHGADLERRVAERSAALRASQARVIHQEKMAAFGLLAAGIAHEVGNPLAALSSLVQMLQRRGPDPYTAEKLGLADRQLGRIQRTIRELVDFARPASPAMGRVRLAEVVEEVLGVAKYYHRTGDRAITTDVPDDLPAVTAPRDHLTQIILNLVFNAIDATVKGGEIQLIVREEPGRVVLTVRDDGRGIAPADRERLFQPYFTTKPRGTGLGLFVSRQIVEELGGSMDYASEPGRGATFRVVMPAEAAGEARPHLLVAEGVVS